MFHGYYWLKLPDFPRQYRVAYTAPKLIQAKKIHNASLCIDELILSHNQELLSFRSCYNGKFSPLPRPSSNWKKASPRPKLTVLIHSFLIKLYFFCSRKMAVDIFLPNFLRILMAFTYCHSNIKICCVGLKALLEAD